MKVGTAIAARLEIMAITTDSSTMLEPAVFARIILGILPPWYLVHKVLYCGTLAHQPTRVTSAIRAFLQAFVCRRALRSGRRTAIQDIVKVSMLTVASLSQVR